MKEDAIGFAKWVTGHDLKTIYQMYDDWCLHDKGKEIHPVQLDLIDLEKLEEYQLSESKKKSLRRMLNQSPEVRERFIFNFIPSYTGGAILHYVSKHIRGEVDHDFNEHLKKAES